VYVYDIISQKPLIKISSEKVVNKFLRLDNETLICAEEGGIIELMNMEDGDMI
jgi:hypothetical protein